MNILDTIGNKYKKSNQVEISLEDYLNLCKTDPKAYATPFQRMLDAIGEPELVDTSKDHRLSRVFANKIIKRYKVFEDFYGIEEPLERLVDYFKHAAQGLEESKQILYLLGPVGSSKSTLAEKLKALMESQPFYAIKGSPVHDSPLGLISDDIKEQVSKEYNIPLHRLNYKPSPWLVKRLEEKDGDTSWIRIIKLYPSRNQQVAVARTEPGDENNQDISSLVGKLDIRKLERFAPDDADSYSYSGGLCLANRGILEFVEMFKAPIKVLHPLLTATQDRQFNGTESISSIPFEGIIVAHSNESEWESFKNDKKNEAFIDRVCLIKIPYVLRVDEEKEVYKKLLTRSELTKAPVAPKTLDLLAIFAILSRLVKPQDESDLQIKMRVYNGENVKDKVNSPKTLQKYKDEAGPMEGMRGYFTPRDAFKVLSKTFNSNIEEIAANPVDLMRVLTDYVIQQQQPKDVQANLLGIIQTVLNPLYLEHLTKEIQRAYLESYSDYGQNIFDKYVKNAECWVEDNELRDPNTGLMIPRKEIERDLEEIERPAGITNPTDFRNEVVRLCLQHKVKNHGKNPKWTEYEKLREVIEKKLLVSLDKILPVISIGAKQSEEDEKKHKNFVKNMKDLGYTERQIRLVSEYLIRSRNIK